MKKNWTLRAGALLMALTLITSCFVGGTFAKYVTGADSNGSARVAKWGVTFTTTSDLFQKQYATDDTEYSADMKISVNSNEKVVAPGTKGEALSLATTGAPEVSYKVTAKIDESNSKEIFLLDDNNGNTINYRPLVFSIQDQDDNIIVTGSYSDIAWYLNNNVLYHYNVEDGMYHWKIFQNLDMKAMDAPTITLTWNWAFTHGDNEDIYDTILGNLADDSNEYIANILSSEYNTKLVLNLKLTATQID